MSGPTGYCPNCKNEVEFIVEGSFLFCPQCAYKLERSQMGARTENRDKKSEYAEGLLKCLRLMFIVGLIVAGIFLVLLAFLYAACSGMRNI